MKNNSSEHNDIAYSRRWLILAVILLSPFMGTLDASIVNVILPVMAGRFGTGIGGIQWVVTIYLIVISSLILIFGKVSDRIGKTNVFTWGFLVFGVGSLFCALSSTLYALVASRVVQAAGAAMFMSCNQGIVADVFPQRERGRALGVVGSAVAVGTMTGPPLGGFLTDLFQWQSVFLINIPVSLFAFTAGLFLLPRSTRQNEISNSNASRPDIKGAFLLVLAVSFVFWALLSVHEPGLSRSLFYGILFAGLICLVLLIQTEKKAHDPLIAMELFRIPFFGVSLASAYISYLVVFCVMIIHPFYLHNVLGMSAMNSGIMMLAFPLTTFVIAPLGGYASDKLGAVRVTVAGLTMIFVGLLLFSFMNENPSIAFIVFASVVIGFGQGMFNSPNTSVLMTLSPPQKYGITGSINAFFRNLGMVSGITFSVSLLHLLSGGAADSSALGVPAMKGVYALAAALCVVAITLTLFRASRAKL